MESNTEALTEMLETWKDVKCFNGIKPFDLICWATCTNKDYE